MRPRIAACVLAMCLPLFVRTASARVDQPPDLDPALLKLEISLDKEAYEVGEPITADIAITNLSKGPISVSETSESTGLLDGYTVVVTASDGQVVPPNRISRGGSWPGRSGTVQPGETFHHSLVTNYQTMVRGPGTYTMKVAFTVGAKEQRKTESDPVTFRVVPTSDDQLRARVEQLKRRLAAGDRSDEVAPLLGMTGSKDAIPPLVEMLQSPAAPMQYTGGLALEMLDPQAVRDAVLASVKQHGPRGYMVNMMERVLHVDGDTMVAALVPWLGDSDPDRRSAAMEGLYLSLLRTTTRKDQVFGYGVAGLKDVSPHVRHAAVLVVGSCRAPKSLAALEPMLDDPDASVKEQAVIAVGWQGTPEAVDALIRVLEHQQGRPSDEAAYWLTAIGGDKADKAVAAALERNDSPSLRQQVESGREQAKYLRQETQKGN